MRGRVYTDIERAEIIRLHTDEGRTIKSLAEEYGVSESTISRWIIWNRNKGSIIRINW